MIEQHFSVFEQKHTRDYGVAGKDERRRDREVASTAKNMTIVTLTTRAFILLFFIIILLDDPCLLH